VGPVELVIRCVFATLHRRDLDNVVKAVCDGLNGVAYADDCQVTSIKAERVQGSEERAEVEVRYPPAEACGRA
jgi:Holliday junction resolvase RusA-like endonuclease